MSSIRIAEQTDLTQLTELFDRYMVFYKKPSSPQRYQQYLAERIGNGEAKVFMHYDENGKADGFILNYFCFSSVSLGPIIVLNDLFVSESARGKGVGEKLIRQVFEFAKEKGAVRVDLGTAKDNFVAQRLYERLGFQKDEEFFSYSFSVE